LADLISAAGASNTIIGVFTGIQASVARCISTDTNAAHAARTWRLIIASLAIQCSIGTIYTDASLNITLLVLSAVTILSATDATSRFGTHPALTTLRIVLATLASQGLPITQQALSTVTFL